MIAVSKAQARASRQENRAKNRQGTQRKMSRRNSQHQQRDPYPLEFNYHLLRHALEKFQKNPGQLEAGAYQQTLQKAQESFDLESLVLNAPEAGKVVIPDQQIDQAVQEVAARYEDNETFTQDLQSNGLNRKGLRRALHRELRFDGVMQKVAASAAQVNEIDVRLFYEMHRERFEASELRMARHILITVNPDFPENKRDVALKRIKKVAKQVAQKLEQTGQSGKKNTGDLFAKFATQYSECPTAMQEGKLGEVKQGQLYPELDQHLFQMAEGEISTILESELGFHLLLCEQIKPGKKISPEQAEPTIRKILQQRQQRNCQKAFLNRLKQEAV